MMSEEAAYVAHERSHYIYRCYDADDRLIYVGCTQDVNQRLGIHRSAWHNTASMYLNLHMVRHEVEGPIKGRVAAREREREVIAAEAPLLNVHHNGGRGVDRSDPTMMLPDPAEKPTAVSRRLDAMFGTGGVA